MKKHIPNTITCCNLICGCFGIYKVFNGAPEYAAYMVWAAAVFDFFDGFAARMLKVQSPIGKELDSLADMVTFGVLPAMYIGTIFPEGDWAYLKFLSFGIAVFSALRLAKFNVDTNQDDQFIGVPTPAMALLLTSFPFLAEKWAAFEIVLQNPLVLAAICILAMYLLVAPFPLLALKFKHFKWKGNEVRFLFLVLSLALLILFQAGGLPLVILLYILTSVINNTLHLSK